MRRSLVVVLAAFLSCAVAAHAGSIPTLTAMQGTMLVSQGQPFGVVGLVDYSFSGNGFSLIGSGTVGGCGFCSSFVFGGSTLDPSMVPIGEGFDLLTIGGTSYSPVQTSFSAFTFGPSFNLPTGNQATFSITLPFTFSGVATPCPFDPSLQACSSGPVATINFNSAGTATLNYTQQGGVWSFTSGTFTLSPVPEPGTFLLTGSGIAGLLGVVRRRRFRAGQD